MPSTDTANDPGHAATVFPSVVVLVINWNGLEHLEACFDSLLASTYPHFKALLIDNASTDESIAFVKDRYGDEPRVEVLALQQNLGWSGGNNAGIEHALAAGAEYIFLLNNDTWTAPDAIERLVEHAQQNPKAAVLAPKMVMFYEPRILNSVGLECSLIGASWDRAIGRADTGAWDAPQPVIGVCGGAMFIRASVLREVGVLPAEFEIYLDDLDLCLRALRAGQEIWSCPSALVRHKFSATLGEGARARHKYFLNTRNRFWLMLRNFPLRSLPQVLPAVLLGEARAIGRAVANHEAWRVRAHLRAWIATLAYLPRAFTTRRRRSTGRGDFWPLVLRRPHFFPGMELPIQGWYRERLIQGRPWRPMGSEAFVAVEAGPLRVFHTNCYPSLGTTQVSVFLEDAPLAELAAARSSEVQFQIPHPGKLRFQAQRLFLREQTGEPMDIGGWFFLEADPSHKDPHQ